MRTWLFAFTGDRDGLSISIAGRHTMYHMVLGAFEAAVFVLYCRSRQDRPLVKANFLYNLAHSQFVLQLLILILSVDLKSMTR